MSIAPLMVLAAESERSGINPYWIGGGIFVLLVVFMAVLLSFGAGRDHT